MAVDRHERDDPRPEEAPPGNPSPRPNDPPPTAWGPVQRPHRPKLALPWLTLILVGMNVVVALAAAAMGGQENAAVLIYLGAKVNPLVAAGEFWRLVAANFVHAGWQHLAFNML